MSNQNNIITDESILSIYNDKDMSYIMGRASAKFASIIPKEELEYCKKRAIWKSLKGFDETKGAKFSTYLYRGVFIECKTSANFIMNHRNKVIKSKDKPSSRISINGFTENLNHLPFKEALSVPKKMELVDELQNIQDGHIVYDFYISNMSYDEIAQKNSTDKKDVKKRKDAVLKKLNKIFYG